MMTIKMMNIIMILIIIIKKEILVEHELFSTVPSNTGKPNPHYFDSQESYVALKQNTRKHRNASSKLVKNDPPIFRDLVKSLEILGI